MQIAKFLLCSVTVAGFWGKVHGKNQRLAIQVVLFKLQGSLARCTFGPSKDMAWGWDVQLLTRGSMFPPSEIPL